MEYTPILKLSLPPFDDVPWDEAVNGDFSILDAVYGKFFGVANLVGVWKNSTAYVAGQSVVDSLDSSMWTCNFSHTSPAAPTTFVQDRGANPTRWINIVSTAKDYAEQAAASAAAAANSATAAAASAAQAAASAALVAGALPLSGGTMTGPIILSADPTNVLGAATKQYVDARVGGTGFLPLSGGTLTGPLTLNGNPVTALVAAPKQYVDSQMATRLSTAGGALTGQLTVGGNGISYAQGAPNFYAFNWTGRLVAYVNGTNVGNLAIGDYLPLTGGYLSGQLTAPQFVLSASGGYIYSDASFTNFVQDAGNWQWRYARASGAMQYIRGSDGAALFTIDGAGNGSIAQSWTAGLDVNAQRSITAAGTVTGAQVTSTGNMGAVNYYASAGVVAGTALYANAQNIVIGPLGAGAYIQLTGGYYFQFDPSTASMQWIGNSTIQWVMRAQDALCFNNVSYVAGHGVYQNLNCSITKKTDVAEAQHGLDEIRMLVPKTFRLKSKPDRIELGFVIEDVQKIIPEAVTEFDGIEPGTTMLGIGDTPILAAAVNAIKQIDVRVTQLEARHGTH